MPTAILRIPAVADQARTARLVAGAAARRAGVDEEAIDDIRLAVAEAVARAVVRTGNDPQAAVELALTDDTDRFEISITDGDPIDLADEEGGLALALITAIAPRARIVDADRGQALVIAWPTRI